MSAIIKGNNGSNGAAGQQRVDSQGFHIPQAPSRLAVNTNRQNQVPGQKQPLRVLTPRPNSSLGLSNKWSFPSSGANSAVVQQIQVEDLSRSFSSMALENSSHSMNSSAVSRQEPGSAERAEDSFEKARLAFQRQMLQNNPSSRSGNSGQVSQSFGAGCFSNSNARFAETTSDSNKRSGFQCASFGTSQLNNHSNFSFNNDSNRPGGTSSANSPFGFNSSHNDMTDVEENAGSVSSTRLEHPDSKGFAASFSLPTGLNNQNRSSASRYPVQNSQGRTNRSQSDTSSSVSHSNRSANSNSFSFTVPSSSSVAGGPESMDTSS